MKISRITEFTKFLSKELEPAVKDVEGLDAANRKPVQKLIYTNLVDGFDHLVDNIILDNCREETLVSKAFDGNDTPGRERDFVNFFCKIKTCNQRSRFVYKTNLDSLFCGKGIPGSC